VDCDGRVEKGAWDAKLPRPSRVTASKARGALIDNMFELLSSARRVFGLSPGWLTGESAVLSSLTLEAAAIHEVRGGEQGGSPTGRASLTRVLRGTYQIVTLHSLVRELGHVSVTSRKQHQTWPALRSPTPKVASSCSDGVSLSFLRRRMGRAKVQGLPLSPSLRRVLRNSAVRRV
jgi:hypothetical protein